MAMGGGAFPFQWPEEPVDPGLDDVTLPPLPTVVPDAAGVAAAYYADDVHAALPDFAAALAAMRREEEEDAGIRLVHLLMSCAGAVEAGDHAGASAHLADAHASLAAVSPASGIGRVAVHFTAALSRRLFPAPTPSPPAADQGFLFHRFYEAGPYLKFAHFTANQAILSDAASSAREGAVLGRAPPDVRGGKPAARRRAAPWLRESGHNVELVLWKSAVAEDARRSDLHGLKPEGHGRRCARWHGGGARALRLQILHV